MKAKESHEAHTLSAFASARVSEDVAEAMRAAFGNVSAGVRWLIEEWDERRAKRRQITASARRHLVKIDIEWVDANLNSRMNRRNRWRLASRLIHAAWMLMRPGRGK